MKWLDSLQGDKAIACITRIRRLMVGNPGDVKSIGEGVSEMRIDQGPGYRLFFAKHGATIVLLLCGGDKGTQARDIAGAIAMGKQLKEWP